jgi:hypothetical protein
MKRDLSSSLKSAAEAQLTGLQEKMSALSNFLGTAEGHRNRPAAAWPNAR